MSCIQKNIDGIQPLWRDKRQHHQENLSIVAKHIEGKQKRGQALIIKILNRMTCMFRIDQRNEERFTLNPAIDAQMGSG